jgi:cell wall-associated NlpC family hydrolase
LVFRHERGCYRAEHLMAAPTAAQFIAIAEAQVGKPYVWGGDSPQTGFDCSGLVYWCLHAIGLEGCPRTSEDQFAWCQHISEGALAPGALIFEDWPGDGSPPGHVIIYIGGGRVVEAPQTGQDVHIRSWSPSETTIAGYGQVPGLDAREEVWLVAFQDNTNQLYLRNSAGQNNVTRLAMAVNAPSLSSA